MRKRLGRYTSSDSYRDSKNSYLVWYKSDIDHFRFRRKLFLWYWNMFIHNVLAISGLQIYLYRNYYPTLTTDLPKLVYHYYHYFLLNNVRFMLNNIWNDLYWIETISKSETQKNVAKTHSSKLTVRSTLRKLSSSQPWTPNDWVQE